MKKRLPLWLLSLGLVAQQLAACNNKTVLPFPEDENTQNSKTNARPAEQIPFESSMSLVGDEDKELVVNTLFSEQMDELSKVDPFELQALSEQVPMHLMIFEVLDPKERELCTDNQTPVFVLVDFFLKSDKKIIAKQRFRSPGVTCINKKEGQDLLISDLRPVRRKAPVLRLSAQRAHASTLKEMTENMWLGSIYSRQNEKLKKIGDFEGFDYIIRPENFKKTLSEK